MTEAVLRFRRSPTLALALEMEAARLVGQNVISLSTPTFPAADGIMLAPLALGQRLTAPEGDPALRAETRATLFGRWGLPEHRLLISAGAKAALFAILRSLRPGTVVVPAPAWPSYDDIVRLAGHRPEPFWTAFDQDFALNPVALAKSLHETGAVAVVLANPGNPTGRIHTPSELDGVLAACASNGAVLILDESFSEIVHNGAAWLASVTAAHPDVVVVNSFSKNHHLQGQRVAACLLHDSRFDDVVAIHQTLISSAPSLGQAAALAALRAGPVPDHADVRAISVEIIRRAGWPCAPSQGSFYHFPRLPDAPAIMARLRGAGLFTLTGDVFGERYGDHLRLCFGRPKAEMTEILQRIEALGLLDKG